MRVAVASVQVPFVRGGAEALAEGLLAALAAAGHQADLVTVPFKWYPPERLLDHLLACRLLDLTESAGAAIDAVGLSMPLYWVTVWFGTWLSSTPASAPEGAWSFQ